MQRFSGSRGSQIRLTTVAILGLCLSGGSGHHRKAFMESPPPTLFHCPICGAKYTIVRVEAPPGPTTGREITCISCGGPLNGREGAFLLKYFLFERSRRRAR
jgi:predicted RNA-binding Zn-ribbon protein involved in translation (DUF1610 family)